jgi:hypothetical protein
LERTRFQRLGAVRAFFVGKRAKLLCVRGIVRGIKNEGPGIFSQALDFLGSGGRI